MSKSKRKIGIPYRQLDLMDLIPRELPSTPGALNVSVETRGLLGSVLHEVPLSRFAIAAKMSELLGVEVTKYQLDSWTAGSRSNWRFPLEYLPAFEVACETHRVTAWLAEKRGCKLLIGDDALLAELGRIERAEQGLKVRKKAIRRLIRGK